MTCVYFCLDQVCVYVCGSWFTICLILRLKRLSVNNFLQLYTGCFLCPSCTGQHLSICHVCVCIRPGWIGLSPGRMLILQVDCLGVGLGERGVPVLIHIHEGVPLLSQNLSKLNNTNSAATLPAAMSRHQDAHSLHY